LPEKKKKKKKKKKKHKKKALKKHKKNALTRINGKKNPPGAHNCEPADFPATFAASVVKKCAFPAHFSHFFRDNYPNSRNFYSLSAISAIFCENLTSKPPLKLLQSR
jgi:hypothetical protein